jgi:hypothetical protein
MQEELSLSPTGNSPLMEGLVFEGEFPLGWEARSPNGSREPQRYIEQRNERLLRCEHLLAEQGSDRSDDERDLDAGLLRIEIKLDMLLDLVAVLVGKENRRPDPCRVRLAAGGLEWLETGQPPNSGDAVWVHLYPDPRLPAPLQLPVTILEVVSEKNGCRVLAHFEPLAEGVQDRIEKLIFRHHRRQVAQSRPTD